MSQSTEDSGDDTGEADGDEGLHDTVDGEPDQPPTLMVPLPDDDPRRDYVGMFNDVQEAIGAQRARDSLRDELTEGMKGFIEQMYDNKDQLQQQLPDE